MWKKLKHSITTYGQLITERFNFSHKTSAYMFLIIFHSVYIALILKCKHGIPALYQSMLGYDDDTLSICFVIYILR